VVDPPRKEAEYEVTDQLTTKNETIVMSAYFCGSESDAWRYASVSWHFGMLVIATVQTFQTRKIRREINESQTLAIMNYSHFVFVCLRLGTVFLEDALSEADMRHVRSIIYSFDCLATINIYFVPKFLSEDPVEETEGGRGIESQTVKQLRMMAAIATSQHERQLNQDREEQGPYYKQRSSRRLSLDPQEVVVEKVQMKGAAGLAESLASMGIEPSALMKSLAHSSSFGQMPIWESTENTNPPSSTGNEGEDEEESGAMNSGTCGDVITCCSKCGETAHMIPRSAGSR
jgi:hypothetical protein